MRIESVHVLTVSGHADGQALLESAILASVSVQTDYEAFPISKTSVLDLLLNAPPEEPLFTIRMKKSRFCSSRMFGGYQISMSFFG